MTPVSCREDVSTTTTTGVISVPGIGMICGALRCTGSWATGVEGHQTGQEGPIQNLGYAAPHPHLPTWDMLPPGAREPSGKAEPSAAGSFLGA